MKILFLPKYSDNGASSRYRTYQYLDFFDQSEYVVSPFFDEKYLDLLYNKKPISKLHLLKRYVNRFFQLCTSYKKYDLIFLEKEFFPYLPFPSILLSILKTPYVVDYDDAVFHNYDQHKLKIIKALYGKKIPKVIRNAKWVITGSPYLTDFALKHNVNVCEIPTSIDIEKYKITNKAANTNETIIGWIGSPSTSKHLTLVIDAFQELTRMGINFKLRLIGFDIELTNIDFNDVPVEIIKWDGKTEISELDKLDVGIMPLIDYPFAQGKCAFKLIQYMAMAKPTISTPFEANKKVDMNNENLFADNLQEWVDCFIKIIQEKDKFRSIGMRNREIIFRYYSKQANILKYKEIFTKVCN